MNTEDLRPHYREGMALEPGSYLGAVDHGEWLQWRGGNRINFSGVNLSEVNLRGVNFSGVDLRGANLRNANLRGANLSGANLEDANLAGTNLVGSNLRNANINNACLRGCVGDGNVIKSLLCGEYIVSYTHDMLQIGCRRYPIADWWEFNDDDIKVMGGDPERWRTWKPILQQIIEASPAKTGESK